MLYFFIFISSQTSSNMKTQSWHSKISTVLVVMTVESSTWSLDFSQWAKMALRNFWLEIRTNSDSTTLLMKMMWFDWVSAIFFRFFLMFSYYDRQHHKAIDTEEVRRGSSNQRNQQWWNRNLRHNFQLRFSVRAFLVVGVRWIIAKKNLYTVVGGLCFLCIVANVCFVFVLKTLKSEGTNEWMNELNEWETWVFKLNLGILEDWFWFVHEELEGEALEKKNLVGNSLKEVTVRPEGPRGRWVTHETATRAW